MTEPERRLWMELRAARFCGVKFRRQKVIGNFIADFASNDPKLVIELDGNTHAGREGYDTARTAFFEVEGYCVVRFTNADVMANMDGVLTRLVEVVAKLQTQPPPPTPSPEGEGALEREPPAPLEGRGASLNERSEFSRSGEGPHL